MRHHRRHRWNRGSNPTRSFVITPHELRRVVPALAPLSDASLARIASIAAERRYAPQRVLYRAGDAADGLYLVLEGRVRVSRELRASTARAELLHSEGAGGVLAEIPVFGGGAMPATAVAIERTRCAHLPLAAVERLVRDDPEFARFALHRLARRAHSLLARIDELTSTTVVARLARYVLDRAGAAGAKSARGGFTLGMSQEALAAELGTAREVVVRGLASLVDSGAIRRTGRSRFAVGRIELLSAIASVRA
jgi:CRP/FNR family transcriptional regulator